MTPVQVKSTYNHTNSFCSITKCHMINKVIPKQLQAKTNKMSLGR